MIASWRAPKLRRELLPQKRPRLIKKIAHRVLLRAGQGTVTRGQSLKSVCRGIGRARQFPTIRKRALQFWRLEPAATFVDGAEPKPAVGSHFILQRSEE